MSFFLPIPMFFDKKAEDLLIFQYLCLIIEHPENPLILFISMLDIDEFKILNYLFLYPKIYNYFLNAST
jgi:hypothetical protein